MQQTKANYKLSYLAIVCGYSGTCSYRIKVVAFIDGHESQLTLDSPLSYSISMLHTAYFNTGSWELMRLHNMADCICRSSYPTIHTCSWSHLIQ